MLRQYKLREQHFECVVRSKELEVLLSRARAAEQKQLADAEKTRADKVEEEVRSQPPHYQSFCSNTPPQNKQLRKELDEALEQQAVLPHQQAAIALSRGEHVSTFCQRVPPTHAKAVLSEQPDRERTGQGHH